MSMTTARTRILGVVSFVLLLMVHPVIAQRSGVYRTPTEPPLCLAPVSHGDSTGQIMVGYASGRIARLNFAVTPPLATWETHTACEILALLEITQPKTPDRRVIAATATGQVLCFRGDATDTAWRFESTCEISTLGEIADIDGDGTSDVLAGGSDQRVHLLSGRTGRNIWTHLFRSEKGTGYVMRLLLTQDSNGDNTPDVAVWLWSGELAMLSGRTGEPLWQKQIGGGMTDALAVAPDLNGDDLCDLLVGGNECLLQACSGRDGTVLWSGSTARPIRDVAACPTGPALKPSTPGEAQSTRDAAAYACTAGGEVVRFDLRPPGPTSKPQWTADIGDVCRRVVVIPDADDDRVSDVAVCAENGIAALLSGRSGALIHRWQAGDVARVICPVRVKNHEHLAVASLDGTVLLVPATSSESAPQDSTRSTAAQSVAAPSASRQRGHTKLPTAPADSSPTPRVIILLYHDILPEARNHYSTSVEDFEAQMDMLVQEHYVCVSLDQIADWIEGKGGMPARAVCITFDGQYRGQCTYAVPVLRQRGLFATSYITTDWIGTSNHSDWRQLREMDAIGVLDIQNHTINHPHLHRLERTEVVRQLADCNQAITQHLNGKVCRHHAYPSGAHDETVRRIVREQGFRTATTARPGPVTRDDDLMALPRYTLSTHKTLDHFRAWLTGTEDNAQSLESASN
ncbi:MAG: polysaccharide deacetylase family protein [Phycisphaerales bacterium]|nr:MAG: polysaccharide deacetylase family protein [Phycisphaerales bacterium]